MRGRRDGVVIAALGAALSLWTSPMASASLLNVDWNKHTGNPVIQGSGSYTGYREPSVIYDGGEYRMWVGEHNDIVYATSPDGVAWSMLGVPPGLECDTYGFTAPCVIKDDDAVPVDRYKMWFVAHPGGCCASFEYATSPDGLSWTRHGTVLSPEPEYVNIWSPAVIKDGAASYKMFFTVTDPGPERIALATSLDGISWTNQGIVFSEDGSGFDAAGVFCGGVYFEDFFGVAGIYHLLYAGRNGTGIDQLGIAWSSDGINWSRLDDAIVPIGQAGGFDDAGVFGGTMLRVEDEYRLWYTGNTGVNVWSVGLTTGTQQTVCYGHPDGHMHWYTLVHPPIQRNWYEARTIAQSMAYDGYPGELATSTSPEENGVITSLEGSSWAWLGGYQDPESCPPADCWHWVTGEPWSYTNWASGEPNDAEAGNENGVDIILVPSYPNFGQWNDSKRDGQNPGNNWFVVEFIGPFDCNSNCVPDSVEQDSDGDGSIDDCDNCLTVPNPSQTNSDGDSLGDACDNCPLLDNEGQEDCDVDGNGDMCDDDRDGDGVLNDVDVCPDTPHCDVMPDGRPRLDMLEDCNVDGLDIQIIVQQMLEGCSECQ